MIALKVVALLIVLVGGLALIYRSQKENTPVLVSPPTKIPVPPIKVVITKKVVAAKVSPKRKAK